MTQATFYDGQSTLATSVDVSGEEGLLHIRSLDWQREYASDQLKFSPAYARAAARIELADGAMCEIRDAQAFIALRNHFRASRGFIERAENAWHYAVVAVVIIALSGAAAYIWGIPFAADEIVEHAPKSIDKQLAAGGLQRMHALGMIGDEQPETEAEKHLEARFAALAQPTKVSYRLAFRSFIGGPNAFALPDGTIVVSKELEALSQNEDAMLFILGHELGHLYYRHSIKLLARATLNSMILSWYVGDVSSSLAVATAGVINLRYSRDAEAQADAFGSRLLHEQHISTRPAADLFVAMEADREARMSDKSASKTSAKTPAKTTSYKVQQENDFLSSHPATADRIAALRADQ